MAKAPVEVLESLNPNILLYPCEYFDNGILPLPITRAYKYRNGKTVIHSEMDLGLSTARRRARIAPTKFTLPFLFSGEQKEVFESWVFNELEASENWFYMPLRTGDYDLEVHKCQFLETPGEGADFELERCLPGFGSIWSLSIPVQTFRARRLERYTARVLTRDSLTGIERAAQAAHGSLFKLP